VSDQDRSRFRFREGKLEREFDLDMEDVESMVSGPGGATETLKLFNASSNGRRIASQRVMEGQ
jgi:hypothetical protein